MELGLWTLGKKLPGSRPAHQGGNWVRLLALAHRKDFFATE